MTTLDPNLVETLLNMSEGQTLDFKRDQYPLVHASDAEKAEIVKDILTFANAWKTMDAYIVIGADENHGGRARLVGVSAHHDDASLQQLVMSKTNVPVRFAYVPTTVDGVQLAIIRIDAEQQRPIFLTRTFGGLKPNVVYIRRGTSTAEAKPDEIARMGAATAARSDEPVMEVDLADPATRTALGKTAALTSRLLEERPIPSHRPHHDNAFARIGLAPLLESMLTPKIFPMVVRVEPPGPDPEKLRAYKREIGLLSAVGLCLRNLGRVVVHDVRVELAIPRVDKLRIVHELPSRPRGRLEIHTLLDVEARMREPSRFFSVTETDDGWDVFASIGKIQPGATAWSDPFWIGSEAPCELDLLARVFGDNISQVIQASLQLRVDVEPGHFDDDVVEPLDDDDDDD